MLVNCHDMVWQLQVMLTYTLPDTPVGLGNKGNGRYSKVKADQRTAAGLNRDYLASGAR